MMESESSFRILKKKTSKDLLSSDCHWLSLCLLLNLLYIESVLGNKDTYLPLTLFQL